MSELQVDPEVEQVLLETNFVVEWAAPTHQRRPDAISLIERAEAGEVHLWIPALAFVEARKVLSGERLQLRTHVKPIGLFLKAMRSRGEISDEDADLVHGVLQRYARSAAYEREQVGPRLRGLREIEGVHVFAMDEPMFERSIELANELSLQPFDQSILAAILVIGERLRRLGATRVSFCELDRDLQPWAKDKSSKQPLTRLYDEAGVWVYEDFLLEKPPRPPSWT